MNVHEIIGEPSSQFLRDRGFAFLDAAVFALVTAVLVWAVGRFSRVRLILFDRLEVALQVRRLHFHLRDLRRRHRR